MKLRSIPPVTSTGTRGRGISPLAAWPSAQHHKAWGPVIRRPTPIPTSTAIQSPSLMRRPDEVIPARLPATVNESTTDNGREYVVRINLPVPIREDELKWAVRGDVLEIECNTPGCAYYRNFLVPSGARFWVDQTPTSLMIRFKRRKSNKQSWHAKREV